MKIRPLRADLKRVLKKHNLETKFEKQKNFFESDPTHPSLNTEKLEPRHLNIYSFRLDRKWRAIFIVYPDKTAEVVDINPHYR